MSLFRERADRAHELAVLDRQMEQLRLGHTQRLEEIEVQGDIAESQALYKHDAALGGSSQWVDGLRASVRPLIYVCPGGWPTIGYRHVVRDEERERFVDDIDEATAEELLRRDVETAERAVLRFIRVLLEDGQFDALSSFAFNLGAGALQRSARSTAGSTRPRRQSSGAGCGPVGASSKGWCGGGGRRLNFTPANQSDVAQTARRSVQAVQHTVSLPVVPQFEIRLSVVGHFEWRYTRPSQRFFETGRSGA